MDFYKIEDFTKGWFIGNFEPSLHKNTVFEVGLKFFNKGDVESPHKQFLATEITVVVEGKIRMNESFFGRGDIVRVLPQEVCDFEAITDVSLICVKFPSIANDKFVTQ